MNYLKGVEAMKDPLKPDGQMRFQNSTLLVGWSGDTGKLGEAVTDAIIEKLGGRLVYDIEPEDYFSLGGVTIEDDLIQFPESKLFICPDNNLIVFKSSPPNFEYYKFFNRVLDIADHYGKTRQVYSIGGMVSLGSHTRSRQLIGSFTSVAAKEDLGSYDINTDSDYQTPPGQKPTLNSYLLWVVKKRNLDGIGLWVPVPFYLMSVDDPKSQKRILEFFNLRFGFGIDFSAFDKAIISQNQRINELRNIYSEIDGYFNRLEGNFTLSEDEHLKLVKQVEEYLKEKRFS
jgi:proteasome assembly chaperone (PAC2) family protein